MLPFDLPLLEKLSAERSTRNYQGRPPLVLTMTLTKQLAIQVFKKWYWSITIVQSCRENVFDTSLYYQDNVMYEN